MPPESAPPFPDMPLSSALDTAEQLGLFQTGPSAILAEQAAQVQSHIRSGQQEAQRQQALVARKAGQRSAAAATLPYRFPVTEEGDWMEWTPEVSRRLREAPWKVVDTETTGLTPQSALPEMDAKILAATEDEAGTAMKVDYRMRCRVLTACIPNPQNPEQPELLAFDLDKLDPAQRKDLANAALSGAFIAHKAGFDLYWLRELGEREVEPSLVLDTMLLARTLAPHTPLLQNLLLQRKPSPATTAGNERTVAAEPEQAEVASEGDAADEPVFTSGDDPDAVFQAADQLLRNDKAPRWSLAGLSLIWLNKVLDKELQNPKEWLSPVLSRRHFHYATSDVVELAELVRVLLYLAPPKAPEAGHLEASPYPEFPYDPQGDILERYLSMRNAAPEIRLLPWEQGRKGDYTSMAAGLQLIEPQVMDVVHMREAGMPWSADAARQYQNEKLSHVAQLADEVVRLVPELALEVNRQERENLADPAKGISARIKELVGAAFKNAGVTVSRTEKSNEYKVGEKDLRKARALHVSDESRALFKAWVGLAKAKRVREMAQAFTGFIKVNEAAPAQAEGMPKPTRIHPLTGHGPATGRLSSAEPNCQQCPREQGFRDAVEAEEGYVICASDFSALDMRVGAALAIRAQRRIHQVFTGEREIPDSVPHKERLLNVIASVKLDVSEERLAAASAREASCQRHLDQWMNARRNLRRSHNADKSQLANMYWSTRKELQQELLFARFERALTFVCLKARAAGTPEWSSLRDAFDIPGMDIHTWTALGMAGRFPDQMFKGMLPDAVIQGLVAAKAEIGDGRQTGKVGNLSLLYAMGDKGLQNAAASQYDMHWSIEKSHDIRVGWLNTYVEIDLWHAWTELTAEMETLQYAASSSRGLSPHPVYSSDTLGGRRVFATSLNAALSYEDQSSGADIVARVMDRLEHEYPEVFKHLSNQVHDELVAMFPLDHAEEYEEILGRVMVECAEHFTMPYGVHCEATPAVGFTWLKDPLFSDSLLAEINAATGKKLSLTGAVVELARGGKEVRNAAYDLIRTSYSKSADLPAIGQQLAKLMHREPAAAVCQEPELAHAATEAEASTEGAPGGMSRLQQRFRRGAP